MKKFLLCCLIASIFMSFNQNEDIRVKVENVAYKFIRATILKDSGSFTKCTDIKLLAENINKQRLDSINVTDNDVYHIFIFRYSPWKITKSSQSRLSKNFTKKKIIFSDYKAIAGNRFYINVKWNKSYESGSYDSISLFFEKRGNLFLIEDVRFTD
jgi:hypothetical protein